MASRSPARSPRQPRQPRSSDLAHARVPDRSIEQGSVGDLERLGKTLDRAAEREEARRLAPPVMPEGNGYRDVEPHPSHGPAELVPRRDDGSLAREYTMDKADLVHWGLDHTPPRRARADGWTATVQADFIRALGDGGSVTRACAAVGRSRQSAYALRRDPSAHLFARAWEEAMASIVTLLAETALDRAVNGQREEVFYQGRCVGTRIRYDNRLLFQMLRARDPLNYAPLDELERWEGRRPTAGDAAAADELETAEAEWARAPREALEAAGDLPLDTAAAELAREGEAEARERIAEVMEATGPSGRARAAAHAAEDKRLKAALVAVADALHDASGVRTDSAETPNPSTSST